LKRQRRSFATEGGAYMRIRSARAFRQGDGCSIAELPAGFIAWLKRSL
jgi:hypothetical protein